MKRACVMVCILAVASAAAIWAGGNEEKRQSATLNIWINAYIGSEEQKLPQEQWYISKALRRFEQANPGVKVEMTVPPDQMAAHQNFKAAAMAKTGPDIANLWNGTYTFALKDAVLHLDGMVPKDDLDKILGWETVREGFSPAGSILGYPAVGMEANIFLFNRELIKKAGLDFDANPPKTTTDFVAALGKIKAAGITPIVADESYPFLWINISHYWWIQVSGADRILAESAGKAKFADDEGLLNALAFYHSLYTGGFLNSDTATSSDAQNRFFKGEAALYPTGNWLIGDARNALGDGNVGVLKPPEISATAKITNSMIGGPGQDLVVARYTKYPQLCVKLMSFLCSKVEGIALTKIMPKFPLRKDVTIEELGWQNDPINSLIFKWMPHYTFYVDGMLPPDVMDEIARQGSQVLVGKMTPKELAAILDTKVPR